MFRTEETAIAAGDLSLMTEGKLKLSYLPDSSTLIKGDLVVTSGLGGYYPSGCPSAPWRRCAPTTAVWPATRC